jgi:pimeloyl-ACP methyl ester carboxylesterase
VSESTVESCAEERVLRGRAFEIAVCGERVLGTVLHWKPGRKIILCMAGDGASGGTSTNWQDLGDYFGEAGLATCLFDYPGMGLSSGEYGKLILEVGTKCLHAVWLYLRREYGVHAGSLLLMGSSFGGAVLLGNPLMLADSAGVVLRSGWIGSPELDCLVGARVWDDCQRRAHGRSGLVEVGKLWDNLGWVDTPSLLLHGLDDDVSVWQQAAWVESGWGGECTLELVDGVGHRWGESYSESWLWMAALVREWVVAHS